MAPESDHLGALREMWRREVEAAGTYRILAGGYESSRGTLRITAELSEPLANDQCTGAINLAAGVLFTMGTTNATRTPL